MDLGLKGRRAIVTGGAAASAGPLPPRSRKRRRFDRHLRARDRQGSTRRWLPSAPPGGEAFGDRVDVRDPDALSNWIGSAVDRLGGLDILVSNISTRVDPKGADWWRETFEVDLHQHVRAFDAALPMLEGRDAPAVVFVSSIASVLTQLPPNEIAYGAMKAALTSFAGQMATVHGPSGVRVNLVAPGPIFFEGGVWDMIQQKQPDLFQRASKLPSLGRMGTPEDVANAVAFPREPGGILHHRREPADRRRCHPYRQLLRSSASTGTASRWCLPSGAERASCTSASDCRPVASILRP
jgi:3-oxoacyl-[acyl-carrier protein] reductase